MQTAQLAINSISTAQPGLESVLRAYADAGFRQVEFNLPFVKKWMQARGAAPRELKALLAEFGLRCVGGFEAPVLAFADAVALQNNADLHALNAELLAELGGGVLVVGTDGPPAPGLDALRAAGQRLRGLAERLHPAVALAVEFNWSPLVKSLRGAALAVGEAAHPRVGILFDPAHFHCTTSKFEDLTPQVVEKILHVHVNDMRGKPGEFSHCNSDRVLPGDGCLDLQRLFGRLEKFGYRGLFSIELFNEEIWKLPVDDAARRCFGAMERLCRPRP